MTLMDEPQKDSQESTSPASTPDAVTAPGNAVPPAPPAAPAEVGLPQVSQAATPPPEVTTSSETPLPETENSPINQNDQAITWTASEFHAHEKSAGWYLLLAIATIVLAAVLYLWTRSIVTPVVIVICGIVFGVYGTHRPNQLEYAMDDQGIRIGSKRYKYDEFRLFVVTTGSSLPEVTLLPIKRFMPPLSVRYVPEVENKMLDMLGNHLPFEERRPELLDSLMRRIHF
jgi:hypothetical protein